MNEQARKIEVVAPDVLLSYDGLAFLKAILREAAGKLYAHATTTCMIFPARG